MTRPDFIKEVAAKLGIGRARVAPVLDTILETIVETVASGEEVKLLGFGKFEPVVRKAKLARNPKTNEEIMVDSRTVPVFKPGKEFRDAVIH